MSDNGARRLLHYKNVNSVQERRQRRQEVSIELRKSKKEDQLFKRRNIKDDDPTSPLKEVNGQSPIQMTAEEIMVAMRSDDPDKIFLGTQAARKMLSRERNPPIDLLVRHGIVPICVKFLDNFDSPSLQFEAAWALTNIASGTSEQTNIVIDSDAIPRFIALLDSPALNVAEQAVWALGNIAGDGPSPRDIVLRHNVVQGILKLITNETPLSFLRNIVWLMSNLCRNKNPAPSFEKIEPLIPVLSQLLTSTDKQVLTDACWALSYVTDDDNNKIQIVIDTGAVPRLVNLLDINEPSVIVPALRSVGNIVTGNDIQTDTVIAAGGLPKLANLLRNPKNNIVKEAAWTVSNITAGNQKQIQDVIDAGLFEHIANVLEKGDFKSQKEAAWVVTNTTTSGTPEQVVTVVEKYKILKPFCDLLDAKDARTLNVVLSGLTNLFCLAEKLGGIENLCLLIESIDGLTKIEALQRHENESIYKMAYAIIDNYFTEDQVEEALVPNQADSGLEFSTSSSNPPQEGFHF